MILKNCDLDLFHNQIKNKELVCFGIGLDLDKMFRNYPDYNWSDKIIALVDNDVNKQGHIYSVQGKTFIIESIDDLIKKKINNIVILITCSFYYEIFNQLNKINELDNFECYIYNFMFCLMPKYNLDFSRKQKFEIPAVIHYCWFGGKELPPLYKKCIESWKIYCPEYKIIEWNESNCNIEENLYASQAYKNRKYGFVPDYFRLKIIYEHGGIYLDTDVELIKNLDDLRKYDGFCGLQLPGEVALGLGFGAKKKNTVIKMLLDRYKNLLFEDEEGNLNETPSPVYQTEDLTKLGMNPGNKVQNLKEMIILPTDVLSPKNLFTNLLVITENTYAIHHFDGSWLSGDRLIAKEKRIKEAEEIQKLFKVI